MVQQILRIKMPHIIAPCILALGVIGIIFNILMTPEKLPAISLYLAGFGSIWSVVIPLDT